MADKWFVYRAVEDKLALPGREHLLDFYRKSMSARYDNSGLSRAEGKAKRELLDRWDEYIRRTYNAKSAQKLIAISAADLAPSLTEEALRDLEKERGRLIPSKVKPDYVAPPVPTLMEAVYDAGYSWVGLDVNQIVKSLPPFPATSGLLSRSRTNPAPLVKGQKGNAAFYDKPGPLRHVWSQVAPEGIPPQPHRGQTYSAAESRAIDIYLEEAWYPSIQVQRFARAVDAYLRHTLPTNRYRLLFKPASGPIELSPASIASQRGLDSRVRAEGKTPQEVAEQIRDYASSLAKIYISCAAALQPGLWEDYRKQPELMDRQYEELQTVPYMFNVAYQILGDYLGRYSKIKNKKGQEVNADDAVKYDKMKLSDAYAAVQAEKAAYNQREEKREKLKALGLSRLYAILRKYTKPPRLQTALDGHPEFRVGGSLKNNYRVFFTAPGQGKEEEVQLVYHDGTQTALMEELWGAAQAASR